jgi:AraC-like DNA-binding protein
MNITREIIPLTERDCFTIFWSLEEKIDSPLHNHDSMELKLILNGSGAQRIVGDHTGQIENLELVFVGSNLPHGWNAHKCKNAGIQEVTLQFDKDLFDEKFLKRKQLSSIKNMFKQAKRGILFPGETIERISPRLLDLAAGQNGFASILELMSVLHDLSVSPGYKTLSNPSIAKEEYTQNSRRIEKVFEYMNAHFSVQVTLTEVANIAGMPEASFSRFIKHRTGYTFIDSLNEIRLSHVSRMLVDTSLSIAEIAFKCGFNNIANFNRTFKNKNGCTPKEFRESYTGKRVFV